MSQIESSFSPVDRRIVCIYQFQFGFRHFVIAAIRVVNEPSRIFRVSGEVPYYYGNWDTDVMVWLAKILKAKML